MQNQILANFEDKHAQLFDRHTIRLNHTLAETGLFSEPAIAGLIDRCRPEDYNISTMGYDKNVLEWRTGEIGNLSGHEVIDAIRKGRMWLNLYRIMERDRKYQQVLDRIFSEFEGKVPGLKTYRQNMTILVSSPKIQVYYHADIQGQSLWQISGRKRVFVYPASEAFLSRQSLEKIILRETEEDVPYQPWFEEYADVYDLEPGEVVHWPLYAPHRVENHDCLNISVTTEHWTREIWNAFAVHYGNGVMRRTLGMNNLSTEPHGLHVYPKAAAAFLWKRLKTRGPSKMKRKIDFRVDPSAEKGLIDIAPYLKAA